MSGAVVSCLQVGEAWLFPLSVGQGKKLEKLSLVLEKVCAGSLVSAEQKFLAF